MWKKGNPSALLVGTQSGAATVENSMEFPQKIKNVTQNTNLKEYMHPCVHCSIIHSSQDMEAAQVPINRQVDKKAVVHIYNGILLVHKKE